VQEDVEVGANKGLTGTLKDEAIYLNLNEVFNTSNCHLFLKPM